MKWIIGSLLFFLIGCESSVTSSEGARIKGRLFLIGGPTANRGFIEYKPLSVGRYSSGQFIRMNDTYSFDFVVDTVDLFSFKFKHPWYEEIEIQFVTEAGKTFEFDVILDKVGISANNKYVITTEVNGFKQTPGSRYSFDTNVLRVPVTLPPDFSQPYLKYQITYQPIQTMFSENLEVIYDSVEVKRPMVIELPKTLFRNALSEARIEGKQNIGPIFDITRFLYIHDNIMRERRMMRPSKARIAETDSIRYAYAMQIYNRQKSERDRQLVALYLHPIVKTSDLLKRAYDLGKKKLPDDIYFRYRAPDKMLFTSIHAPIYNSFRADSGNTLIDKQKRRINMEPVATRFLNTLDSMNMPASIEYLMLEQLYQFQKSIDPISNNIVIDYIRKSFPHSDLLRFEIERRKRLMRSGRKSSTEDI